MAKLFHGSGQFRVIVRIIGISQLVDLSGKGRGVRIERVAPAYLCPLDPFIGIGPQSAVQIEPHFLAGVLFGHPVQDRGADHYIAHPFPVKLQTDNVAGFTWVVGHFWRSH